MLRLGLPSSNVAAVRSALFRSRPPVYRAGLGDFALMDYEMTTREAAGSTVPGDHHALQERDASKFPLPQKRIPVALSSSRAFRLPMAGSPISMLGSWISAVAFPMLVLHPNTPFIIGLIASAVIAPNMLVNMPAGALVDRWDPKRVMLVSELFRGLVIATVDVRNGPVATYETVPRSNSSDFNLLPRPKWRCSSPGTSYAGSLLNIFERWRSVLRQRTSDSVRLKLDNSWHEGSL